MNIDINTRIREVSEEALLAFWAVVAEKFPEAKSGDFPPDLSYDQSYQARSYIRTWVRDNSNLILEIDSPKWFEAIAAELRAKGLDADASHTGGGIICVLVNVGAHTLWFGTANENWGFDVYDNGENEGFNEDLTHEYGLNPATQMTLSCETSSPAECADAIAATVAIFKKDREAV